MPMTYGDMDAGDSLYQGQIANQAQAKIRSAVNEEANVVPVGYAAVQGAADDGALLPVDANSVLIGVFVSPDDIERRDGFSVDVNGDFGIPVGYRAGIVHEGVVGVKVAETVSPIDDVFWVHTTNGASIKGMFRTDADTGRAVQASNARFLKSGAAGSVVPLAIDLP